MQQNAINVPLEGHPNTLPYFIYGNRDVMATARITHTLPSNISSRQPR